MPSIASVALARNNLGTIHCGMFYEISDGGPIKILHLAKQCQVRSSDPCNGYLEVVNALPERTKIALSNFCRLVYRNHSSKGLRYSASRTDEFLPDGMLKIDAEGVGFTCATFVKGIFDVNGAKIIDEATWPLAGGEDTFVMRVLNGIFRRIAPQYEWHYWLVDRDLDVNCRWSRFKSEEIGAASTLAPPPAKYFAVLPVSRALAARLKQYPILT